MMTKHTTILLHAANDSAGSLPDLLNEFGINLEIRSIEQPLPEPETLDLLFVLGSPESAYDHRLPWLAGELHWLRKVQKYGTPTFGICFGSQILSRALGGEVYRNSQPEIGWTPIDPAPAGSALEGPWLNFHFDAFTPPPGAILLGRTELAAQAYRQGDAMGVQFHPEITPEMFDTWIDYWNSSPEGQQFMATAGDLPERMRAEITEREPENRARCRKLLRAYLDSL
ncbi:GMP synthase [Pseudomonas oleovorans subsp. oleovorans]|uniref:Glutamine amidotransferase n=1 Tax=Ectopseudomonas oleovorans TaxID=301 RepID=A0A379JQV0_ECTOL|nr:type 1 glutamine amidotransferase [Pseudomonas oleovorans]OWK44203.1 GMP synthase [Pseudomonas oleovorans subsp. oleovorans]SEJ12345.1 GMP synthase-Glutamine amidotransferase [Pseudomonas oleovorans]SUD50734.1 glutamine amidotransferase [Pseudomonas oleovorans]